MEKKDIKSKSKMRMIYEYYKEDKVALISLILTVISSAIYVFACYLMVHYYGWKLFWGVFLFVASNNIQVHVNGLKRNAQIDSVVKRFL
jgi:hypothetical protein